MGLLFGILLDPLGAIQEGVLFGKAFDALVLVGTGGVVAGAMVVEVITHFWLLLRLFGRWKGVFSGCHGAFAFLARARGGVMFGGVAIRAPLHLLCPACEALIEDGCINC